jgi:hypothetical protein
MWREIQKQILNSDWSCANAQINFCCAYAQVIDLRICAAKIDLRIGEENSFFSDVTDVPSCANAQMRKKKHLVGTQPQTNE